MPSYEEKRRNFLAKNLSINFAQEAVDAKLRFRGKTSEDSLLRKEIHGCISDLCISTKKTKNEILQILNNKFSDSKYDKYHKYFEIWVTDCLERAAREESER